jgi:anti-sigma B factor antagonist
MSTTTKQLNTVSVVLNGDFDAEAVKEIRPLFHELSEEKKSSVIIEMSDVSFIDSSGIGAIVFLYKRLVAKGLELVLVGPTGQPLQIMEQLRINQSISFFVDMKEYFITTGNPNTIVNSESQRLTS